MKPSAIVVAAFAALVVGCRVDSVAPPTGGVARFILRGKVTNLAGTALQNVTVQVQPLGGGNLVRQMQTDASGNYRTFGLAAGIYRVVVVMGDSSRITATGRKDTVYVGPSAESTIVGTISYDPGKIVSGSLTYTYQDTGTAVSIGLRGVMVRLYLRTAVGPPEVFAKIDSIPTSASGAFRFAVRPSALFRLNIDTTSGVFATGFPLPAVDPSVPRTALTDSLRITTATFAANVTTAAAASITYRAPYTVRARIFKDRCVPVATCTPDGVFLVNATNPDSLVGNVKVWLRRAASTTNLGSSTVTSGTSGSTFGLVTFNGLRNAPNWTLHVIRWYLPALNCFGPSITLTPEGDIAVTPILEPVPPGAAASVVVTKEIPLVSVPLGTVCP
jgi:hypothetical protein